MLVRITNVPSNCCGVMCQGHTGKVMEVVAIDEDRVIYILENGALVWAADVVEIEEIH